MIFLVITPRKKDVAAHPFFLSKFNFFKKNLMIMQVKEFIINKELDDGGIYFLEDFLKIICKQI